MSYCKKFKIDTSLARCLACEHCLPPGERVEGRMCPHEELQKERVKIMMDGKVVGVAENAKITVAEDEDSTKEWSDPWRTPYPTQSWDITGKAIFQKPSDVLRGLLGDKQKFDVIIRQEIGKLPRKMKKALHTKRMAKWKQRVEEYINRHQIHLHDVAIEVESAPPIRWEARRDSATAAHLDRRFNNPI